jgi:hypothetical protein
MSNDVALFEGLANVPAHLQDGELSDIAKALGARQGGDGLKRISFRGGVFRMMVGSKEIAQNDDRSMNIVIVKAAPGYARTYYKDAYREGVVVQPTCWSDNNDTPSSNCETPQSNMCATCPHDAKGSSATGKGKACRSSARLAVVLEGDQKGDVYGITFPGTSIWGEVESEKYESLQNYVKKLATFGYDVAKVVTEMRFDTSAATPKLMFRAVRPLEEDEYATAKAKAQTAEADAHTGDRKFVKSQEEDGKPAPEALFESKGDLETDDEPKKVSKAKPESKPKADVADILDEWGDD